MLHLKYRAIAAFRGLLFLRLTSINLRQRKETLRQVR